MDRRIDRDFRRFRRTGDGAALGRVFDASAPELASLARYLTRDASEAEDVLQATYLTAIEKAHAFEDGRGVVPWLVGILARHAARARRNAARTPDPRRLAEHAALAPSTAPAGDDPARAAEKDELVRIVESEVDALPPTYAAAVRPYLTEGAPAREIGAALGITSGAASVRVHRGLGLLRERLRRVVPGGAAAYAAVPALDLGSLRDTVSEAAAEYSVASTGAATSLLSSAGTGALMTKKTAAVLAAGALLGVGGSELTRLALASPAAEHREETDRTIRVASAPGPVLPALDPIDSSRAPVANDPAPDPVPDEAPPSDDWLALLNTSKNKGQARAIYERVAALPEGAGVREVLEIYDRIEPAHARLVAPEEFLRSCDPDALEVLHRAAGDADVDVRSYALTITSTIAMQELRTRASEYAAWRSRTAGGGLDDAIADGARRFATGLGALDDGELIARLEGFTHYPNELATQCGLDLTSVLLDAGFRSALERLLARIGEEREAYFALRNAANFLELGPFLSEHLGGLIDSGVRGEDRLQALRLLRPDDFDEEFARARLLPLLEQRDDLRAASAAADLLGAAGLPWALDPLLDAVRDPRMLAANGTSFDIGGALGDLGDPRAIPTLIGAIAAQNGYETVYGLGYFGLQPLTGVPYDESHDGAFWHEWWEENRARYGPEIASLPIPVLAGFDD
ncbi:MAG: sigma-70 family RNA polymerase sigma factor [Planctomycetota bacterium]